MNARILFVMAAIAASLGACTTEAPPAEDAPPVVSEPSPPTDSQGSPWDQAKARGVGFRGIGTEPGWMVEVGTGEAPALHAALDYGERKVDVARMQALSGILGYAGATADGIEVKLHLQREDCSDGMSDQTYPVSARLSVGDGTYQGCGRFLQE